LGGVWEWFAPALVSAILFAIELLMVLITVFTSIINMPAGDWQPVSGRLEKGLADGTSKLEFTTLRVQV